MAKKTVTPEEAAFKAALKDNDTILKKTVKLFKGKDFMVRVAEEYHDLAERFAKLEYFLYGHIITADNTAKKLSEAAMALPKQHLKLLEKQHKAMGGYREVLAARINLFIKEI